jgi:hypothetical protein
VEGICIFKNNLTNLTIKYFWITVIVLCGLICPSKSIAQIEDNRPGIRVSGVISGTDTIPSIWLNEILVSAKMPPHIARQRRAMAKDMRRNERLRYNVFKVYPYAVIAADILKDVDDRLAILEGDKKARRRYLDSLDSELTKRFKGDLENLNTTQGQILCKLINRQTGKNVFHIIRELKGGFSAVVWQSLALLFSQNLKKEYDPTGKDADIETIVLEIEAYYSREIYNTK